MLPTMAFADGGDEAPSISDITVKRLEIGKISIKFTPSNIAGYNFFISKKNLAPPEMSSFTPISMTGDFYSEAGSNQLNETDECVVYIQIVNAKK